MNGRPSPRVALVLPFYDPRAGDDPSVVVQRYPTVAQIARAEAARGMDVRGFQLFPRAARLRAGGAELRFVPSSRVARRTSRWMHRLLPRHAAPYWEPAAPLLAEVRRFRPEVVHLFGATLDLNVALTAAMTRQSGSAMVVHYHGGLPEADVVTQRVRRAALGGAQRVLFTHRQQADPWVAAGMIRPERVDEVVETSTTMEPWLQARARSATGIDGQPACVMVARLHPVKDPLTVLAGFAMVAERRPLARLHLVGPDEGLEPQLRAIVAATPALAGRVRFHGALPSSSMPAVYGSADVLLQASRREWSGLSVLEAMVCGVVPVLSDIPAFRAMTDDGRAGRLFAPGDAAGLARHVLSLDPLQVRHEGARARRYFHQALSFPAIARRLENVYQAAMRERGRGQAGS